MAYVKVFVDKQTGKRTHGQADVPKTIYATDPAMRGRKKKKVVGTSIFFFPCL